VSDFEPSVTEKIIIDKELHIDENTMHGLNALLHWLKGFEASGNGNVPGHFELVMFYRTLKSYDYDRRRREADEMYKLQQDDSSSGES